MQAVLIGSTDSNKLYFIADALNDEPNLAIEKPNGSVIYTNFLDFCINAPNITKIRNTRFHRFLWDKPQNIAKGAWYDTFVERTRPIKDSLLEDVVINKTLGTNRRKLQQKNDAVNRFVTKRILNGCCDEMIQLDDNSFYYKNINERKDAWTAIVLLNKLEEGLF